jgi:hypothetical protein
MNEPVSKFWLVCEDNVCHCDWRFSIVDCDEEYYARIFYIVTGVTSGVLAIIGTRNIDNNRTIFFLLRSLLPLTIRQTNINMYYFLLVLLRTYIRYEK